MVKKSVKGISKNVDPITELKDIKNCLSDNPRDLCLFMIGINTNLRASDSVRITIGMVKKLRPGEELVLTEKKTKKKRRITLNKDYVDAIKNLIQSFKEIRKDNSQLFMGISLALL